MPWRGLAHWPSDACNRTHAALARARCMRLRAVAWLPAWLEAHRAVGQAPDARPQRDAAGLLSGPTIVRPRSSAAGTHASLPVSLATLQHLPSARIPRWPCHWPPCSISHLHESLAGRVTGHLAASPICTNPSLPYRLAPDSISHLHLITHRTSSPPWPLAAPLFPPAPLRSLAAKPHSPVSQICALTVLPSTAMLRVANSTPMVLLLSRENSLRVKRLSRFDLPVPESPMRTTLNCRAAGG
jgi:hypothetical protein